MPYLRIFDSTEGVREVELSGTRIPIGRQAIDGILIEHTTVSRIHAVIHRKENHHLLEDANSRSGTYLNGTRISRKKLHHGDTIVISVFVLEYRTDDAERHAAAVNPDDTSIDRMLRMNFRRMPASIRLRYRVLSINPMDVFEPGDTLRVGDGGVLIPTRDPIPPNVCIEVEITPPGGKARTFLGEVLGMLDDLKMPSMCIKLHDIGQERYQHAMKYARRSSWLTAPD